MLTCLRHTDCDYAAARREYEKPFALPPGLKLPSRNCFQRFHTRMFSTGSVRGTEEHRVDAGRPCQRENFEEEVMELSSLPSPSAYLYGAAGNTSARCPRSLPCLGPRTRRVRSHIFL